MQAALLIATMALGQTTVEPGRVCPNAQQGIRSWITYHMRFAHYGRKTKARIAKQLSERIVAEAKRHGLDPIVMATIAWIESDYKPGTRGTYGGVGRRRGEVGVWQLIPWGWGVKVAARTIVGCRPGKRLWRWQWPRYRSRFARLTRCDAPDVGLQRMTVGHFHLKELRDVYLSTYIAAYEMRLMVRACFRRRPAGHAWNGMGHTRWFARWSALNPGVDSHRLARYAHYNFGPRWYPRGSYMRKLLLRYSIVRDFACYGRKPTWRQWRAAK